MLRRLFTLFILLALVGTAQADNNKLHIAIGSGYPPFYFLDANRLPTGICIDIINQVAHSMDITVQYDSYPWKRMLNYGKEGKVDAVMPLFKTDEREQFLFFPETDLIEEDNSFFTSRSNPIKYSGNLADVIDRTVSVIDKYSYGKEFDNTHFTNKTYAKNTEQLIKQVQNNRIELGIGNSKVISYFAKQMGAADKQAVHLLCCFLVNSTPNPIAQAVMGFFLLLFLNAATKNPPALAGWGIAIELQHVW